MHFQRVNLNRYFVSFIEEGIENEEYIIDSLFQREVEKVKPKKLPPGPQRKPKKTGGKGQSRWATDAGISKSSINLGIASLTNSGSPIRPIT